MKVALFFIVFFFYRLLPVAGTALSASNQQEPHARVATAPKPVSDPDKDQQVTCRFPTYLAVTPDLTKATIYWSNTGTGVLYDIRWRRYESGDDWTIVSQITSASYVITNLTPATLYEWQLQTVCPDSQVSGFIGLSTFRTLTPPCTAMFTVKAGLWHDPTVWSCLRVPVKGDKLTIFHPVTLPSLLTCTAINVTLAGGKLVFSQNSTLRLSP